MNQSTDKMRLQGQRFDRLTLLALQFLALTLCTAQYTPPPPEILPLYPKGIRFSIPDEAGITLVAYHAKFNEDFNGLEAGTIARDIVKVKNNRWTYEDHTTRLKIGDIIYLWIHVIYEGLGYNLLDQVLEVTEFFNPDGTVHTGVEPVSPTTSTERSSTYPDTNISCYRSSTYYNGQQPCVGQLLFEEHFNELLPNRWRVVKEFAGAPDYEFVVYQDREETLSVKDGELRIKPTLLERHYDTQFIRHGNLILQNCTGRIGTEECERRGQGYHILPPLVSGLIDTKESFNFLYGRIQIRAKLPQGDWIYPILILHPVDAFYGSGYQSGELRVASAVGNRKLFTGTGIDMDGRELRAGAVVSPEGPIRRATMSKKISAKHWSDDYHLYELEWTPTSIIVKVDGEEYGSNENPAAAHRAEIFKNSVDRWTGLNAPFDKPRYLSLGVAVGGHGEFADNSMSGIHPKPWRNVESKALLNFYSAKDAWIGTWTGDAPTLKVDYVKIWAL